MKAKTNVLITGASGTVGSAVLEQLVKQPDKYQVTVLDRKTKQSERRLKPYIQAINLIYGDISNLEDIQRACIHQDFVIHLAAIIPPLADDHPVLARRVNVEGTKNLVAGLERESPDAFLLYSSSISVYGDRTDYPDITINSELKPSLGDEYAKTKIEAEQIVMSSKLNWSIFRLTAVMGYGNHKVSKLMFHMPLRTSLEIATPEDTARAFVNAIGKTSQIEKQIYNLGGGKQCRIAYEDFLTKSFAIMGLGKADFPEQAFAESNFHCGNYTDGDELEKIVNFRNDTIDTYFLKLRKTISPLKYLATYILKGWIKQRLLKLSDAYREHLKFIQEF